MIDDKAVIAGALELLEHCRSTMQTALGDGEMSDEAIEEVSSKLEEIAFELRIWTSIDWSTWCTAEHDGYRCQKGLGHEGKHYVGAHGSYYEW